MQDLTIQQQGNSHTFAGRNDRFFQAMGRSLRDSDAEPLKVLSFGCSTGEECLDLARLLPGARIFGTDIKRSALQKAEQNCPPEITLFISTEAAIQAHGPYDAIAAMSVFCLWPATSTMENIAEVYPFSTFENGLISLFRNLKLGGLLLLQNGQYMVEDTIIADKLEAIDDIVSDSSGWIFKCAPNGDRVTASHVDYDGRKWEYRDFFLANADKIKDTNYPIDFRVSHIWINKAEQNGRNADIALWRKVVM